MSLRVVDVVFKHKVGRLSICMKGLVKMV